MKKTIFKNQYFYKALIIIISLLICWNLFAIWVSQRLFSIIIVFVMLAVLILIVKKNKHAKLGINIWIVFLVTGPILSIFGKSIKIILGEDIPNVANALILNMTIIICSLFIYHFNKTTVTVEKIEVLSPR
jgi:FtsH-binding integral membrane protein